MGFFGFGSREKPGEVPNPEAKPSLPERGPKAAPDFSDRSIQRSLELEGLAPGKKAVITADGSFGRTITAGAVIRRESNSRWVVSLHAPQEGDVVVVPRKGEPRVVRVGESIPATAHDQIKVEHFTVYLPGYGLTDRSPSLAQPTSHPAPVFEGKSAYLNASLVTLKTAVGAIRGGDFSRASNLLTDGLDRLDVSLDRQEELVIEPSYLGAIRELRSLHDERTGGFNGETLRCPTPFPVEDNRRPGLTALYREIERETAVFLALNLAMTIGDRAKVPLSTAARNHVGEGPLSLESDAALLLRELGTPLSKFFFVPGLTKESAGRVAARLRAYELIQKPAQGTAEE